MRRVVITGLGTVAPCGNDVKTAWQSAIECKSGIVPISLFDATDSPVKIAGEVHGLDLESVFDFKELKKTTRFVQFACAATKEALQDSGLEVGDGQERWGTSIGVGMGAMHDIENNAYILKDRGPKRISPFFIPFAIPNMAAGYTSLKFGLKGPNMCTTTACASGTHAIGEAFRYIQNDYADVMVCGGAESTVSPLAIAAFNSLKALSQSNDNPEGASRPFDLNRNGFVMGEGAGIVVLEDLDHAQKRGARIYAELVGYGMSGDAHHITAPSPDHEGGARCMKMAIESGQVPLDEIGYINAHGTSTKMNDHYESLAISQVLGSHADQVSVSSTKGVTGHCIGAAGGIEAVYSTLAIYNSMVPPTANLDTPDPQCTLDYTPKAAKEKNITYALSNSFGFGGTNATIALKKFS